MKICPKCKKEKELNEFPINQTKIDGHAYICKECNKEYSREYRKDENNKKKIKEHHRLKKEHMTKTSKEYRAKHKDNYVQYYINRKLRQYNITLEQYNEMYNKQEGKCAICGKHQNNLTRLLVIDHNHLTGKIRGLLCGKCNLILGHANDNVQILTEAINYLNIHNVQ